MLNTNLNQSPMEDACNKEEVIWLLKSRLCYIK